jgi:hypothetical protein
MSTDFKVGDHVEWHSEAGRVRGTIEKKITSDIPLSRDTSGMPRRKSHSTS